MITKLSLNHDSATVHESVGTLPGVSRLQCANQVTSDLISYGTETVGARPGPSSLKILVLVTTSTSRSCQRAESQTNADSETSTVRSVTEFN
eukprot:317534-Hanusia_phi.AAC.1